MPFSLPKNPHSSQQEQSKQSNGLTNKHFVHRMTMEKTNRRRSFRLFGKNKAQSRKLSVSFALDTIEVHSYDAPEGPEERARYYPDKSEAEVLKDFRRSIMTGYQKGSASFKSSVEKVYSGARRNYDAQELSSGEFNLSSAHDEEYIHLVVAADVLRGLEELYCGTIHDHRQWAIRRVVECQRERSLRKQLPSIAATVSTRSKNFARLVALGDAEEARRVSTAHAA